MPDFKNEPPYVCPQCYGEGELWGRSDGKMGTCDLCGGTGGVSAEIFCAHEKREPTEHDTKHWYDYQDDLSSRTE